MSAPPPHDSVAKYPAYEHEPLPDVTDAFRLFRLEPRCKGSRLRGQILHASLGTAPPYDALSYCWGDPAAVVGVLCDGRHRLSVTENCAAALRSLRHGFTARLLWIDAICIDQRSDADKAAQIPSMGEIYRRARQVIIWLGAGSFETSVSFDRYNVFLLLESNPVAHRILEYADQIRRRMLRKEPHEFDLQNALTFVAFTTAVTKIVLHLIFGKLRYRDISRNSPTTWEAVLSRPWFSRMWVVQEAAMARSAVMRYGNKQLRWEDFARIVMNVEASSDEFGNVRSSSLLYRRFQVHQNLARSKPEGEAPAVAYKASNVLLFSQFQEASEPRDKVYALFGIFRELGITLQPPDYHKSVADVYRETCLAIMVHENSLKLLGGVWGVRRPEGLPSWVPDLSVSEKPSPIDSGGDDLQASGESDVVFSIAPDSTCLCVVGSVVDRVKACAEGMREKQLKFEEPPRNSFDSTYDVYNMAFLSEFCRWTVMARGLASYPTGEEVHYAMARTVYRFAQERILTWAVGNLGRIMDEAVRLDRGLPRPARALGITGPFRDYKDYDAIGYYLARVDSVLFKLEELCYLQNFFVTDRGYMGLAPIGLQAGDLVCLVSGYPVPLLMRPIVDGRGYTLVGPAHIHGMMEGQLWTGEHLRKFELV